MQPPRDGRFARAGLAFDQDREVRRRDAPDALAYRTDARTRSEDGRGAVGLSDGPAASVLAADAFTEGSSKVGTATSTATGG